MGATTRRLFWSAIGVGLAFGLASCASGPEAPSWARGKQPEGFPEAHYTWGVGSGAAAEVAAASATREIARKTGGESEGAKIERQWIDEEGDGKIHWALAVLDRTAQIERLTGELAATDASLAEMLASAEQETPPSKAFAVFFRAIKLASARDEFEVRIGRLGGPPSPGDPSRERTAIEERLASYKHALTIDVEASEMEAKSGAQGDALEEIRTALAQVLLERGFRIATQDDWSPSSTWLLIRARVGLETLRLGSSDRYVAVRWNAVVEVHDRTGEGEVLAILTKEGRAAHLNEHEARRAARIQAEEFAASALGEWLDQQTTPSS